MSTLIRDFTAFGDRYQHDVKRNRSTGWAQVDTYQDASYFGVWTNPTTHEIFTYCEGDLCLEQCDDDADYIRALRAALEFYDDKPHFITRIDAKFAPELAERFIALGFADRIH